MCVRACVRVCFVIGFNFIMHTHSHTHAPLALLTIPPSTPIQTNTHIKYHTFYHHRFFPNFFMRVTVTRTNTSPFCFIIPFIICSIQSFQYSLFFCFVFILHQRLNTLSISIVCIAMILLKHSYKQKAGDKW